MNIGENIQNFRKDLGLSQEELAQKIPVSRQTVSQWENGQTVPSIDNLIILKEIFGVSVDEILGVEVALTEKKEEMENETLPREKYTVQFSENELKNLYRTDIIAILKKPAIIFIICVLSFINMLGEEDSDALLGMFFISGIISLISMIRNYVNYSKMHRISSARMAHSTYIYSVFDSFLTIDIYRGDEKLFSRKCYFKDIEKIQHINDWIYLQTGGQIFLIKKNVLNNNSFFYTYMYNSFDKIDKKFTSDKFTLISKFLCAFSVLTIFAVLNVLSLITEKNIKFDLLNYMWVFFLFIPVPIASVIYGFWLKNKGYFYKKNVITGTIVAFLLCIFGSFTFIFPLDHSDTPVIAFEQATGIDIPAYERINTLDWTKGEQTVSRGYVYSTSDIYFNEETAEKFEKQLADSEIWLEGIPDNLIGISSTFTDFNIFSYALIFNTDTKELNTLPQKNGCHHFINAIYYSEPNQLKIVEYEIDYTS